MRLLVANANTTEAITDACAAAARAAAAPGTEIIPATPRFGPAVITTRAENVIAAHALLDLLAEQAGQVDAVLLAVSHDTALDAARQIMPCPVVGMTEAACLTACMLGGRFGLVTFGSLEMYRELIARYGLAERLVDIIAVNASAPEAVADPDSVGTKVLAAAKALAAEGANAVVLAGAALAGFDNRLQAACPVALLDGMACGVRMAELLVSLRLPRAQAGSYAPPKGRMGLGISPGLAALLRGDT
ncbi:aspartate/glutamate racemase family protein [Roseomonas sp. HJA6]|uniref:Aspartate/glutamate racemase family protein n=1 Tax=Roseomonas alba TaxID=2846776 RepID=A0ABS7A8R8_9PROT|nr:aspartate/glutamate racemase family protein [Neoroseomonas alba]MBW6398695.1 aspartate/glutamate racemase family protein [Neoroseomonas alba]